jgi:hypothetical protein
MAPLARETQGEPQPGVVCKPRARFHSRALISRLGNKLRCTGNYVNHATLGGTASATCHFLQQPLPKQQTKVAPQSTTAQTRGAEISAAVLRPFFR